MGLHRPKVRERREMKERIESEIQIPRGSGGELPDTIQ